MPDCPDMNRCGLRSTAWACLDLGENIAGIVESIALVIGIEARQRAVTDGRRQREQGQHSRRTAKKTSAVDHRMSAHTRRQDRRRCPGSSRLKMHSLPTIGLFAADLKQYAREIEDLGIEFRRSTRWQIDCRQLPFKRGPEPVVIRQRPIAATNQLGFREK